MAVSPDTLATQLADAGLVDRAELDALREQHQPADAEALARLLVKHKVLTAYQAQQAYAGKSKALVLGNYIILDKLGQGGMGMVLKARHRRMNRIVALKVLSPAVTKTPDAMKRFQREVEAAAKLHHPHIVTAHDADEVNGTHFLVMEYVEGTDLSVLVKKKGPLPVDQAINCMLQAARGLEYAHRHGVIHRDIKPANLLLDKEGTIKVLDMGLARIEGETGANAELTSTGAVMGTVDYMAPEQALSTKSADARSDIYSLGISLWYLLIGRPVFDGDSLMARLIAHRETPPPSLKEARGEVPAALDVLFQKMIAKKSADRCQSMTEVIAALETCHFPPTTENSTPSFTTGPSEQTRLSEFMGLFGGGTDPASPTRSVPKVTGSATARAPASGAEYDVTVTSATGDTGSLPSLATTASKPPTARSRWLLPGAVLVGVAALLFVTTIFSTTKPDSPTTVAASLSGAGSESEPPAKDGKPVSVPSSLHSELEFDGVDDYVDLTSDWQWDGKELTFEAWLIPPPRQEVVPPAVTLMALEQGDPATGPRARLIQTLYKPPTGDPKPQMQVSSPARNEAFVSADTLIAEQLTHVAAVWSGRETRLFIDGKLQPKSTFNYAFKPREGDPYLWLGALRANTVDQKPISFWKGRIRQVRITARAIYDADFTPSPELATSSDTVGLYRLEEGSGDVLKDSSGHNRHGKIHGATWRDPTRAQSSPVAITSGVELDGIDDYIDLTSDWAYNGGPVTVEFWTTPGVPALVEPGMSLLYSETPSSPSDHPLKFFYLNPSTQVANDGELHLGRPPDANVAAASYQLRPGVRTHLAAVFDGKESTFFVDGRPLQTKVFLYSWPKHEGERFTWIGAARSSENGQTTLSQFWTGIVHNFRISSSARYTSEFKPPLEFRVDPATEGLYLFDEGAGSIAKDSSGHKRHGKIVGGQWAAPGQPPADGPIDPSPGSSLRFDGSTAFVEVPTLTFDGTRPITLEAWVLGEIQPKDSIPAAVLGWNAGATLYRNPTDASYRFHCWGPEGEEAGAYVGAARESRRLHHVAGVWDGSTLRTFLDGKPGEVRQVDQLLRALRDNDALKENFCIGASIWYGTGAKRDKGEFFKGYIDEVRVSQSARYSAEFVPSRRFEPDADTLALFHFDEGSGTVSRDASGNGHDGRIVGAKWILPKAGSSVPPKDQSNTTVPTSGVELDGIDDYIDLTSDWIYAGGPVTVEVWTTPGVPASEENEAVLLRGEAPSDRSGGRLKVMYRQPSTMPDGELTGELSLGRPPDVNVTSARHTLQPQVRTHLAAVYDGKQGTIFVDGRPKVREATTYQWPSSKQERHLWVGAAPSRSPDRGNSSANWTGIIHNIRISSTARYAEEFVPQPDYEPDPLTEGLYRFDEGSGAIVRDSSGYGRHGRIVGGSWAGPGQVPASGLIDPAPGSYLQFDGATSSVEVPSLTFDGKRPLTFEAWVLATDVEMRGSLRSIMGWSRGVSLSRVGGIPWYLFVGYGSEGGQWQSEAGVGHESRRLHHVAGVWDGSSLKTFFDGKPGKALQLEQGFPGLRDIVTTRGPFCIGASMWDGDASKGRKAEFFKGFIDEVRVSQTARYRDKFTPSKRFESDADTLALFHFDEGEGTEVRDASGHGHHGKILGAKWVTTSPPPSEINLLNDLKTSGEASGNMRWTREGQSLVGQGIPSKSGGEWFGLMFPQEISGSYDLEIEFNQRGCYPLQIDIPVGETFCRFDMSPESCGMLEIDDKHGQEFGPPYHHKNVKLKSDVVQKLAVSVRLTGDDAVVKGTLDGQLVGEFSGSRKRLSLPHWVQRTKPQVFIGALADLSNMRLVIPLASVHLRSSQAPPPAVAPFKEQQAKAHQAAWADYLGVPVECTNILGMKLVLIPPGEYDRGQGEGELAAALAAAGPDRRWQERIRGESPRHRVRLTQPFFLGATEVTQGQFADVTGRNPSHFSPDGPGKNDLDGVDPRSLPVENVSWQDIADFCGKLSDREGLARFDFEKSTQRQPQAGYRLPSEAQWEFACRAGTTTRYSSGDSDDDLASVAWYVANSRNRTQPVAQRKANPFGLFDLHGNVWETTADGWDIRAYEAFKTATAEDPRGPNPPGDERVVRGGDRLDVAVACRAAHRGASKVNGQDARIGFRVALSVEAARKLSAVASSVK